MSVEMDGGGSLLEHVDGRVVAEQVITDLGGRHDAAHLLGGAGDSVRTKVDEVGHGKLPVAGASVPEAPVRFCPTAESARPGCSCPGGTSSASGRRAAANRGAQRELAVHEQPVRRNHDARRELTEAEAVDARLEARLRRQLVEDVALPVDLPGLAELDELLGKQPVEVFSRCADRGGEQLLLERLNLPRKVGQSAGTLPERLVPLRRRE